MKLLIDARLYGLEHGGIGRYVMNLVQELSKIDKDNTYEILLRKIYCESLSFPPKWRKHEVDVRHYSLKEQITVKGIIDKLNPDLVHFPHFNVPLYCKKPYVVTIHDLSKHRSKGRKSTTLPQYLYFIKRMGYEKVFRRAVMGSRSIITPTKIVKNDLLSNYDIQPEKVVVTYEGVSVSKNAANKKVGSKYNLSKPYFVYTGSAYPHKNLDRLVEAMVLLNKSAKDKVTLYICSSRSIFTHRLEKIIKEKMADEYVKLLGFVPDDEISTIYKNSVGFVYPSLMEGFGLPGLEAMSSGTISLVSDIAVFKEVYQDKTYYFNPYDFSAISKAMSDVLALSSESRKTKIFVGKEFVKKYSWEQMAKDTLKVYESSAGL